MPRTVHIGLDLFVEAGTPVLAPISGVVESVRDNGMDLDYGPTVILRHEPADGPVFHTLYGHLGREIPDAVRPGARIDRGQPIAAVGALDVNGGWPPHLHFQIITDLLDRDGEFPGVAASGPAAVLWKSLSPDPNLIARLPEDRLSRPHRRGSGDPGAPAEAHRAVAQHLLSAAAHHRARLEAIPLRRGRLRYLDAVNNVAHVGHGHPRVVRASGSKRQCSTPTPGTCTSCWWNTPSG